jgi:hypothetical protein
MIPMPTKKPAAQTPAAELLAALAEIPAKTGAARGVALNNVLLLSLGEKRDAVRATKLREFTLAMVEPLMELAEGEVGLPAMTYSEIVTALVAGALYVHADRVMGKGVTV